MTENRLISEQSLFGLGFSSNDYTFTSIEPGIEKPIFYQSRLLSLEFEINPDHVCYTRAIYGFWDFLGDVGGLFDMLKIIVYPVTVLFTTLFRTGLNQYLLSALFQIEKKRKKDRKT